MVNELIRLDDEANFESIQQKFEWTRTSLVISLSLLIRILDSNDLKIIDCLYKIGTPLDVRLVLNSRYPLLSAFRDSENPR